jgi:hypothetical protein
VKKNCVVCGGVLPKGERKGFVFVFFFMCLVTMKGHEKEINIGKEVESVIIIYDFLLLLI